MSETEKLANGERLRFDVDIDGRIVERMFYNEGEPVLDMVNRAVDCGAFVEVMNQVKADVESN